MNWLFCLKWDPCERQERREKGVFRATHPHTPFLGQCPPPGPAAALFSSNVPISCQFREFLSLINVQEHSFHQFQGLRRPREQSILIIHFMRKLRSTCFSAQLGDFGYFTAEKHPNLGNWGVWFLDKNWATLKSPAAGKKANLPRFGALKFWQHWMDLFWFWFWVMCFFHVWTK